MSTKDRDTRPLKVCIVGSGTTFLSGISYYTYYLAKALNTTNQVSAILMRNLLPKRFYPGRDRVGAEITDLKTVNVVPTFDGVDWFIVPSLWRARRFMQREAPDVVVFQWWTGTVLVSFLLLARVARKLGARVILEFHEDQDTGEVGVPFVERVVRPGLSRLIGSADHFVVHSDWDRERLCEKFQLDEDRVSVIPLGPFVLDGSPRPIPTETAPEAAGHTDDGYVTILFFGTIRPYKGLEDLVEAFALLPRAPGSSWRLLVVGETWEGWNLPRDRIAASPNRAEIEFVNRYVSDAEVVGFFDRADIVALPYLRSSASGPLHLAMQRGLPIVVTEVGGLTEASDGYSGTVLVPVAQPAKLAEGIVKALDLRGAFHADVHSWEQSRELFDAVFSSIGSDRR